MVSSDSNVFEDLSGATVGAFNNPYDALILACQNDQALIQNRYATHRTARNAQKRAELLDPSFRGFSIDPILFRLVNHTQNPDFIDPRHCLVFWARPPNALKGLIGEVQAMLKESMPSRSSLSISILPWWKTICRPDSETAYPSRGRLEENGPRDIVLTAATDLWLMPIECLHMTALEITHSQTQQAIEKLVQQLSHAIPAITDFPYMHRSRLIKPMLSYDTAAIALSFVPAAGEGLSSTSSTSRITHNANRVNPDPPNARETEIVRDDNYTYHHLRRSLYDLCIEAGVEVASRYTVPSAHLTIARFISQKDISAQQNENDGIEQDVGITVDVDIEKVKELISKIEEINAWLQDKYWPIQSGEEELIEQGGEWIVGEEKGLDCRKGTLWYGGGETVRLGNGFAR